MNTIGERLRAERARLGLTQDAMAQACGIAKNTQYNFEAGSTAPNVGYLSAAAAAGVDVSYVVCAVRSLTLPGETAYSIELFNQLVDDYRALAEPDRLKLNAMATALVHAAVREGRSPAIRRRDITTEEAKQILDARRVSDGAGDYRTRPRAKAQPRKRSK